ncbi:hypothetical protein CLCR_10061 [Cladophialophora carrionii]|uniref:F-box domain-containing protein n=1 Tax=Cladophialophora carrionii TaxID=86049 RepID=A0A1C1CV82_9EURO|nr:hypothetical protein CLCR_10061 [Cladophialophora carrionii]
MDTDFTCHCACEGKALNASSPLPDRELTEQQECQIQTTATQGLLQQWFNLPEEIKANILKWVGRRDLRSCRLVDRQMGSTATRILFRTVCLSPSMNSVDRLCNISCDGTLASLVHTIEVHTHYLIEAPFSRFVRSGPLAQRLQSLAPLDAAVEALELSGAYNAEIHSQATFANEGPPLLWIALKKFPQLRHFIHVRPLARTTTGSYVLDDDSDLMKRTGVCMLDGTKQFPLMNSVLQKCRHLRPRSIDLASLYWWEFYNISHIPHLKELLSGVTRFKLTLQVESFDRPRCRLRAKSNYWANGLTKYLTQLPRHLLVVENLWLGFDRMPSMNRIVEPVCAYALRRMTTLFLRSTKLGMLYSNLKILTLENMATTVKELSEFILTHAGTLKSLTLADLYLRGIAASPNAGILCSIIKLTMFLNQSLKLSSMAFRGTFRDHLGVSLVCSAQGPGSILHRVQEHICHRGEFPLKEHKVKEDKTADNQSFAHLDGNSFTTAEPGSNVTMGLTVDVDQSWYLEGTSTAISR